MQQLNSFKKQAGQMLPRKRKSSFAYSFSHLLESMTHAQSLLLQFSSSGWMTFLPLCSSGRQDSRSFELTTRLQEDNNTVAVWWRLFGIEHLIHSFWFTKAADTILSFSVFIQALFRNMLFSHEENPPGMASLIPLHSALLRPHLECCVLFLGSPAQERQWHTAANPE